MHFCICTSPWSPLHGNAAVYIWRSLPGKLCAWAENTWPVVGTVNGHGYNGLPKTLSAMLVGRTELFEAYLSQFSLVWLTHCAYKLIRCRQQTTDKTDCFAPCTCAQGNDLFACPSLTGQTLTLSPLGEGGCESLAWSARLSLPLFVLLSICVCVCCKECFEGPMYTIAPI